MDQNFVDILQKLIAEQGKEALLNPAKCKAFLADYTKGEYKKESRLLLQALEAGVQKEIITTVELELCKKQQARVLREEHFVAAEAAADIVDTLALVLKGKKESETSKRAVCSNCGKELQKEWKICPFCGTQVENTSNLSKETTPRKIDTVPLSSGNTINNAQQKPATISTNKAVDAGVENTSSPSKETTQQKNDTAPLSSVGTINNTQQKKPVTTSTNKTDDAGVENTSSPSKETTQQKNDTAPLSSVGTINNAQQKKPVTTSSNETDDESPGWVGGLLLFLAVCIYLILRSIWSLR